MRIQLANYSIEINQQHIIAALIALFIAFIIGVTIGELFNILNILLFLVDPKLSIDMKNDAPTILGIIYAIAFPLSVYFIATRLKYDFKTKDLAVISILIGILPSIIFLPLLILSIFISYPYFNFWEIEPAQMRALLWYISMAPIWSLVNFGSIYLVFNFYKEKILAILPNVTVVYVLSVFAVLLVKLYTHAIVILDMETTAFSYYMQIIGSEFINSAIPYMQYLLYFTGILLFVQEEANKNILYKIFAFALGILAVGALFGVIPYHEIAFYAVLFFFVFYFPQQKN